MSKKIIQDTVTGEISVVEISELDKWRKRLSLSKNATEAEIQAERQRRKAKTDEDERKRERLSQVNQLEILDRIEALEGKISDLLD